MATKPEAKHRQSGTEHLGRWQARCCDRETALLLIAWIGFLLVRWG